MRRRERRLGPLARMRLAAEILATYVTVRRLVRRRTLPQTVAELRLGVGDGVGGTEDSVSLGRHLAWATVRTISLLPTDTRCLMRSLVLTRVLARRGLGSTLILSAASDTGLEAHAWVEHAGQPLLLPGGPGHRQLIRL